MVESEGTQHLVQSKAVTSMNCGPSEGGSKKRPFDCSSPDVLPKYKRRNVNAVRDFPPGCGRFAAQINVKPKEVAGSVGNIVENTTGEEKRADVLEAVDSVKACGSGAEPQFHDLEMPGSAANDLESEAGKERVEVLTNVEPVETLLLKANLDNSGLIDASKTLEREALELLKDSDQVEIVDSVTSVDGLENGNVMDIAAEAEERVGPSSSKLWSPPQSPIAFGNVLKAEERVGPSSSKLWSPPQSLVAVGNVSKETVPRTYPPRRRISAIRDFPQFCGRDAARLSKEEILKAVPSSENKSLGRGKFGVKETVRGDVKQMGEEEEILKAVPSSENKSLGRVKFGVKETVRGDVKQMGEEEEILKAVPSSENKSLGRVKFGVKETVRGDVKQMGEEEEILKAVPSSENKSLGRVKFGVKETIRGDVTQMGEDVQDGDTRKSKLKGIVSVKTGDKVKSESEREASKEMRRQVQLGTSSEIKVEREDTKEKSVRPRQESIVLRPDRKSQTVIKDGNKDIEVLEGKVGKEIVIHMQEKSPKRKLSGVSGSKNQLQVVDPIGLEYWDRVIVQGLMAAPNCPWKQGKGAVKPNPSSGASGSKGKKHNFSGQGKSKSIFRTKKDEAENPGGKSTNKRSPPRGKTAYQGAGELVVRDEEDPSVYDEQNEDFHVAQGSCDFHVIVPPLGVDSSGGKGEDRDTIVTRNKVRETLRLFQAICRKLLQEEEAKSKAQGHTHRRIDLPAAKILKDKHKYVNTGKPILGAVPGVEVGDEFQYRVELAIVGIHRLYQAGIDYTKQGGEIVATSIVASGGYPDDLDNSDVLIYSGSGGNVTSGDKQPEDQKLERGNLALKNSIDAGNPVRVIRGLKETKASDSLDARAKTAVTYTYDGLYTVERYWQDVGSHGKLVFKFELRRIPGQPELAWKEVKKSRKFKVREGICADDISQGKELIPICAVNTIDNEKPPPFKYITKTIYPDWYHPIPPKGCDCTDGCSDSEKCSCAVKNGGEIPYNYNGAIVEVKPLVYECGPSCKCPRSCHNRVSQHGIKFQLEIFKTESRGWGVRSLMSIPSGSFICEYTGELLEDKEAEQRTGNDEYLFDIGHNYNDHTLWGGLSTVMPDAQSSSCEVVEDGGFTIDAAQYGSIGRFINHSCSPNLYAQNVLYDHEDKRMPHIMLFAAENIPPLQELTYHYNYTVDQVRDSNGNIKKKSCYCGSPECTGRMY